MAKKIVINLNRDERFHLWGRRIVKVTLDGKWALLFGWDGFVGSVDPDNVPQVHNVIEARKTRIGWDEALGQYVAR